MIIADAPGAADFVRRCSAAAADLALLFAHQSDDKVASALARMRQNLYVKFCGLFPKAAPETMAAGVDSIIAEIQKRRREIESASAVPAHVN